MSVEGSTEWKELMSIFHEVDPNKRGPKNLCYEWENEWISISYCRNGLSQTPSIYLPGEAGPQFNQVPKIVLKTVPKSVPNSLCKIIIKKVSKIDFFIIGISEHSSERFSERFSELDWIRAQICIGLHTENVFFHALTVIAQSLRREFWSQRGSYKGFWGWKKWFSFANFAHYRYTVNDSADKPTLLSSWCSV